MMMQPGQPVMPVMMQQPGQPMMMAQPGQPMMMAQPGGQQMMMQPVMMPGQPQYVQQGGQMMMVTPMTPGYVCVMQTGEAMQVSSKLERIFLAIGWKNRSPQKTVDIDASCVMFSGGKMHSSVSFQNLKNEPDAKGQSSVVHTGDVLTGGEQNDKEKFGDDLERVYIWLPNVTTMVDAMYFIINVYSDGMTFKDCESAYV